MAMLEQTNVKLIEAQSLLGGKSRIACSKAIHGPAGQIILTLELHVN